MTKKNLSVLLITTLFQLFACRSGGELNGMPQPDSLSIHYLALGDSYTIGQSVPAAQAFPRQLADTLAKQSDLYLNGVQLLARTGWTTRKLLTAIADSAAKLRSSYELVTLLIGVNNLYQNQPINVYRQEFRTLLGAAIDLAGNNKNHVLVLSIPDYGYTPVGQNNQAQISVQVDAYNQINRQISDSMSVKWINITPISRLGLNDTSLVANDGLHPSGKMYARWVAALFPEVRAALK